MARLSTALALLYALSLTGAAAAASLLPQSGYSVHLGGIDGTVYYTAETEGFRVVATMAPNDASPMRFISTLTRGQRLIISIPQAVDRPPVEFEIRRDGDMIVVGEPDPGGTATANLVAGRPPAEVGRR
jgi:hypothetical protein